MDKKRIVILGGGFAGVYAAKYLQKLLKKCPEYELCLVSRENYFTYQPMLSEIIGGSIGVTDSVNSLRNLLPNVSIYIREISDIDIVNETITLSPNFNHKNLEIKYEHLIIALGNVTDFRYAPGGLKEHALGFKTLSDAILLRNRLIDIMEVAAIEENPLMRKQMLTVVVAGGGFSGVEVVAEVNDFIRKEIKKYKTISEDDVNVILIHSKSRLMDKELSPSLSLYAEKILKKRGVKILFEQRLASATPYEAILDSGERIPANTIVSTIPSSANPLIEALPLEKWNDRVKTDEFLRVLGTENIWALGDAAAVPTSSTETGYAPATAQFATREAKCLAHNLYASITKAPMKAFHFKALGMMAALGHRSAVVEMFGKIKMSGFIAWLFWRAVYWVKLPGFSRKLKVALSWLLDIIIPAEPVQFKMDMLQGMTHLHYEANQTVFQKGDIGDYLYIIVSGKVQVLKEVGDKSEVIATIGAGEYFGEMALLNEKHRNATIKCIEPTNLIAMKKQDFQILITNFGNLKEHFQTTQSQRISEEKRKLFESQRITSFGDILHPPSEDDKRKSG
ncbi:MAG: cyclic nucleotide-binding domain-containing protein [Chlamydiae bacterium]|nr:cyclic nucleotide-binding domain-containing protein [Chlamydiota bacterium]